MSICGESTSRMHIAPEVVMLNCLIFDFTPVLEFLAAHAVTKHPLEWVNKS